MASSLAEAQVDCAELVERPARSHRIFSRTPLPTVICTPVWATGAPGPTVGRSRYVSSMIMGLETIGRTLLTIITACTLVLASTACWTLPAADEWRYMPHMLVFDGPEIVHSRGGVVARVPGAYAGWLGDLTSDDSLLLKAMIASLTSRCPAEAQLTTAVAIENESDRTVTLYPERGYLVVGDQEVHLKDCLLWSVGTGAELAPGEERKMALIIGLPGIAPGELRTLRYVFDAPLDEDGQPLSANSYSFEITLEPHSGD